MAQMRDGDNIVAVVISIAIQQRNWLLKVTLSECRSAFSNA